MNGPEYGYEYSDSGLIRALPPVDLDRLPAGWGSFEHIVALPDADGVTYGRISLQRTSDGTAVYATPGIAPVFRDGFYIGFTRVPETRGRD